MPNSQNNSGFDNMQVRKTHLEKLDNFVKTLYDETKVFGQYMNVKDLEMLYLHIHDLIQEMLQCQTTDEFMAMIEQLHQSIAGVLIVIAPAKAGQVKMEMKDAHTDFQADSFDDLLDQLQKTAAQKFGQKGAEKAQEMAEKMQGSQDTQATKERTEEDASKLINQLGLDKYVKEKQKEIETRQNSEPAIDSDLDQTNVARHNEETKKTFGNGFNDPLDDLWNNLK